MRHRELIAFAFLAQGCSGNDTAPAPVDGSSADAVVADVAVLDTAQPDGSAADVSVADGNAQDGAAQDSSAQDTGTDDANANDAGPDAPGDGAVTDASDAGCPATWLMAPAVDMSIAVPADGGSVIFHTSAGGTQNYVCTQSDAGFVWAFAGPEAELRDCNASVIGHHFATDAGPGAPEWQTTDGTYVVGKRIAPGFVPDGGAMSVPWLLLQGTAHGGTAALSRAGYIQRLYTDGGVAPSTPCDQTVVGTAQASQKVPYAADYYFFGQ